MESKVANKKSLILGIVGDCRGLGFLRVFGCVGDSFWKAFRTALHDMALYC